MALHGVDSMYRGFLIYGKNKDGYHKVRFLFKHANHYLPRTFKWSDLDNQTSLRLYIDALVERNTIEARKYEDAELAYDHEYVEAPADKPIISISPTLLVAVLLGEMPLEVPIHSILRFKGSNGRYVPNEMMAELANADLIDAFHQGIIDFVERGLPVCVEGSVGVASAKKHERGREGLTPAVNLEEAAKQGKGTVLQLPQAVPPAQPVEVPLMSQERGDCIESICGVEQADGTQYFVRRLISPQGEVLYVATAWSIEGPWAVHQTTAGAEDLLEDVA